VPAVGGICHKNGDYQGHEKICRKMLQFGTKPSGS
jgi:hypothetical protein